MLVTIGHGLLWLALLVAIGALAAPLAKQTLLRFSPRLALLQCALVSASFAIFIHAHATSDFSVLNVALNSHSAMHLLYKITGSWGNHEGSLLLWIWLLTLYGAGVGMMRPRDTDLQRRALVALAGVAGGFLLFLLLTSNPFLRVIPPPPEGNSLNPLLEDIGLAMHPPMLYSGYVGFGMVFAYAVAGLWRGRIDRDWASAVQPWLYAAWTTLTLGIALGSWWAYRELGWGGWWFWDPVENVSLLPWFTGTALLHSLVVLARRGHFARWVALLAILSFAMSLMGTFIVRSGLVMSVHAFTSDPTRGYAILLYTVTLIGGALTLYARSCARITPPSPPPLYSREGTILLNNLLMLTLAAMILLAVLTPLMLSLAGLPSITVGAPYFNSLFFPLAAPVVLLAALSPLIPWGARPTQGIGAIARPLLAFAGAGALLAFTFSYRHWALMMLACGLGAWLAGGTFWAVLRHWKALAPVPDESAFGRALRLPLSLAAMGLSHLGLAVLCFAVATTTLQRDRFEEVVPPDGIVKLGDYTLTLTQAERFNAYTYEARRATFRITKAGRDMTTLSPEIRRYAVRVMETSEVAIDSTLWRDVYLAIGPAEGDSKDGKTQPRIGVRLYVTPGMAFLWLGFAFIVAGGACGFAHYIRKARGEYPCD